MLTRMRISALALGVAGMVLAASQPAAAAPVATNTAALKAAAPDATTDVQYRRYRRNWVGPAIGLGIIGAGIAAATAPRYYYYDEPYAYYAPRAFYAEPRALYADPYPYAYGNGYGAYYGRERFW